MDLVLNNLQRLIRHKTQPTNQPTNIYQTFDDCTERTNYNWYHRHFPVPYFFQFSCKVKVIISLFTFFQFNPVVSVVWPHTYTYTNICGNIVNNNDDFNEQTNTLLYKNMYLSHILFSKGGMFLVCERWVEDSYRLLHIDPSSSDQSSTSFSSWQGLLNRGSLRAQSPLSAAGSHFGILSPTDSNSFEPSWAPDYMIVSLPPASAVFCKNKNRLNSKGQQL